MAPLNEDARMNTQEATATANDAQETRAIEETQQTAVRATDEHQHLLELRDLNVTYLGQEKRVHAVRDVSFSIDPGDSIGVVGESGSGKSTMAMAVLRLLNPKQAEVTGQALFEGTDLLSITEKEMNELRWTNISIVFQKAMNALSPVHRISRQAQDIYRVHYPDATDEEIRARMIELLRMVNLPERVYTMYPHELSGGMLQRVCIALSLMHNPKLLVLDEATTALDVVTQGQILSEIAELEKTLHTTRITITHDMSVVSASCNRTAVMYAGELMEVGSTRDVLKNPKHPYTQGLLASFPSLKGDITKLQSIPGYLPDLSIEQPGCAFAPRCPHVMDCCRAHRPHMVEMEAGHTVNCWLYDNAEEER